MPFDSQLNITECPRDAMQGIADFIPSEIKIKYLNLLLRVGFDKIDFGSFVSPKAIPQMRDTAYVLNHLDLDNKISKLLAIVANERGANDAISFERIDFLGFPFSVSETFQQRNTNAGLNEALVRIEKIQNLCFNSNKALQIYLSMGFGNPYGDPWNPELVLKRVNQLVEMGIKYIALSDTVGVSDIFNICELFSVLTREKPDIVFIAHLHSQKDSAYDKIKAAYDNGCRHFDSALNGMGGCPLAKDELIGNIPTETLFDFIDKYKMENNYDLDFFKKAISYSNKVF
jgi:hydroxymethylglutaryl-CoA lyase